MRGALSALAEALDANAQRAAEMRDRISAWQEHPEDAPWSQATEVAARPGLLELLTQSGTELNVAGVRLRRTLALTLRHEGLTTEEIAERFGVSRQRVSALLRATSNGDAPA
jgi:hypothetical protein